MLLAGFSFSIINLLEEVTPSSPSYIANCGDGGQVYYLFKDNDKSNSRTTGDQIEIIISKCEHALFSDGEALITVLSVDNGEFSDVLIDSKSGKFPYLRAYDWHPRVKGKFRLTADKNGDIWLRSEGKIEVSSGINFSEVSNLALIPSLVATTDNPLYSKEGMFDLTVYTSRVNGGLISVDTTSPVTSSFNVPPAPGSLLLTGSNDTAVHIYKGGAWNDFYVGLDTNSDDVFDKHIILNNLIFLDGLSSP